MGYLGKEVVISNVIPPMISNSVKVVPLVLSLLGALLAFVIYDRVTRVTGAKGGIRNFVRVNSIRNVRSSFSEEKFEQKSPWTQLFHVVYTFFNSAWQFNYVINHFIVKNV